MTCDYLQLATAGVKGLQPYQPGKPIEELERELGLREVVKLASNENPLGPGPLARQAYLEQVHELTGNRLPQLLDTVQVPPGLVVVAGVVMPHREALVGPGVEIVDQQDLLHLVNRLILSGTR